MYTLEITPFDDMNSPRPFARAKCMDEGEVLLKQGVRGRGRTVLGSRARGEGEGEVSRVEGRGAWARARFFKILKPCLGLPALVEHPRCAGRTRFVAPWRHHTRFPLALQGERNPNTALALSHYRLATYAT